MTSSKVRKNTGLLAAFDNYKKRYLNLGKKPNLSKLLPEVIYRTMRLEEEKFTRKQTRALFQ